MFKVNNKDTRTKPFGICEHEVTHLAFTNSKLTIDTLVRDHWRPSGVSIVNFEHISHLVLVALQLY